MDRRTMMIGTAFAALFAAARAWPQGMESSKLLNALFKQFMKENLDLSPLTVTNPGMDTGPRASQKSEIDGSEAGIERQRALIAPQLARLTAFDRASLSASDATSYDVVMYGLRTTDAANKAFHCGPSGAGQPYVVERLRWRGRSLSGKTAVRPLKLNSTKLPIASALLSTTSSYLGMSYCMITPDQKPSRVPPG